MRVRKAAAPQGDDTDEGLARSMVCGNINHPQPPPFSKLAHDIGIASHEEV